MTQECGVPVEEALRRHYATSGLPPDGGHTGSHWTMLRVAGLGLRLRNFGWRRRALPIHDLHHLVTGYPCTVAGELQIAAWEFAAGRFPHPMATLFCLPLVVIGAVGAPRRSFAAFVRGRRSRTLYSGMDRVDLRSMPLAELRERLLPAHAPRPTLGDRVAWTGLALCSSALVVSPPLVLSLIAWWSISP